MKMDTVMDDMKLSIIELFQRQKKDEEESRTSLGNLVREGARLMLQTAHTQEP
jgi:hypothetical protein